jgi:hypothetical protein
MRAFASVMMIGGEFEVAELAADISKLKPHALFISGYARGRRKTPSLNCSSGIRA